MGVIKISKIILVLALSGLSVLLAGCSVNQSSTRATNRNEASAGKATTSPVATTSSVGFASREKLVEHYHKHGREFGDISIEDYLKTAQTLRDRSAGGSILEAVRDDGVINRFDRDTRTFIAFNRDGIIRTCFKPNDGESYFRRQLKRRG